RAAFHERALHPRASIALARHGAERQQPILHAGHGEPERARLRARAVPPGHPPLERDPPRRDGGHGIATMSTVSPLAGKPAPASILVDVAGLVDAYYTRRPDPSVPAQRVAFGTSGHRGSSLESAFNEAHILAVTQAICIHRRQEGIDGPLFVGFDTHALSK